MDTVWPSGNISFILVQHAWGQFQSRPVWNCSSLMAKTSGLKLGITKNIKLITYRQIDHTADPSRIKDFLYLIICMDAYIICTLSSGKANQRANQTKNNEVAHTGKKTKHVFLYIKKKEINNMKKKQRNKHKNKEKQTEGGGQKRSWRLIFDFWWRRAEPIRAADRDCDHWLSSSGPVSVSMLLLSVSEASVCSVDMDEMSLADEDWEAEPDTTSDNERFTRHTEFSSRRVQRWSNKIRKTLSEVADAPTWTIFFHQSVLVPFFPVDHFLIY